MDDLEAHDNHEEEYYCEEYEPCIKDWEILTWGKNDVGQLGTKRVSRTGGHLPELVANLKKHNTIIQVSVGLNHMAGVTKNGDVFVWGSNSAGQAGQGDDFHSNVITKPMLVRGLRAFESKALMVACGETHTLCMLRNGLVYAWGKGDDGRLGCGRSVVSASEPLKLEDAPRALNIAAGIQHSAILGRDKSLYTFGSGDGGRLGHGTHENQYKPCIVQSLGKNVMQVDLGPLCTAAVTENGHLFIAGQLSSSEAGAADMTQFPLDTPIKKVSVGHTHALVLTNDNQVMAFGSGLGTGSEENVPKATLVRGLESKHAVDIAAGNGYSMAVIDDGFMYCWGNNALGQLGNGCYVDTIQPEYVRVGKIGHDPLEHLNFYDTLCSAGVGGDTAACLALAGQRPEYNESQLDLAPPTSMTAKDRAHAKMLESITVQMEGLTEQEKKALTEGGMTSKLALTEMQSAAMAAGENLAAHSDN